MAFVLVLFRGEEVCRRELTGPTVVGRSPDCDISVRDIILSRHHCRFVPVEGAGWAVEDLGSKNGTRIGGETVQYAVLHDGTSIRIGKTQVKFYAGHLSGGPPKRKPSASANRRRPADPFEAMSGTVADFEFVPEKTRDLSKLPTPRPQPADPDAYADEDVYSMLTEIASSSWDSIYATASEPAAVMVAGQKPRKLPVAGVKVAGTDLPPRRRNIVPDASLQVEDAGPAKAVQTVPELAVPSPSEVIPAAPVKAKPGLLARVKHILSGRFLRRAT